MKAAVKGFTLIELMVVVAIIGIVASFAVPVYQGYVIKVQLNRVVGELSGYKSAVEYALVSSAGLANSDIGYVPSSLTTGNMATDIAVFNADGSGHLGVTLGGNAHANLAGVIVQMQRSSSGGWQCVIDNSAVLAVWRSEYLPAGCAL